MANSLLTPLEITREGLRVLHQESNFIGNVNRQYDDRFAVDGAKIGTQLNIRMPPQYSVRTGATYSGQDQVDRSQPLYVSSQYGVDVSWTSAELAMSLDDFSGRFIRPAMAQLVAKIEADCLTIAKNKTYQYAGTTSTSMTYLSFAQTGQRLSEKLAPKADRAALMSPLSRVNFGDATKGLFQSSEEIAKQYKEGIMGRTGGFTVYENTLLPTHTIGTLAGTPLTTGAAIGTSTTANAWVSSTDINIDGATSGTTIKAGDILTFGTLAAGLVDVHPESKVSLGRLKTFVANADVTVVTAGTATVTVLPGVIYGVGNAYQNCSLTKADTDNMTVTNWGAASSQVNIDLMFHKDAFVFATADLIDVSKFGAWGARESMDGISLRLARQYDASADTVLTRFDILWGFAPLYNQLACKHIATLA